MLELGQFVKERRTAAGLSQKKLGKAIGVSDSEIQRIEAGERQTANWENLCKIAKALSFHPFEILRIAGYISEEDIHPVSQLKGLDDLSKSEVYTVQLFIDFIKTQRNTNIQSKEDEKCITD